jgi:hypothetical protein
MIPNGLISFSGKARIILAEEVTLARKGSLLGEMINRD